MGPQVEQILDKSILPSRINRNNPCEEELRCLQLYYQAFNILTNALSKDAYNAFITSDNELVDDVHDIWTKIIENFDESKSDSSFDASTSSSICETKTLKEEVENVQ
jgi:hypothetical protein